MIGIDQARSVIAAGEAEARRIGAAVSIAVLDGGAHLLAFARIDAALLGSIDIALGKARTSVLFDLGSEAIWDYARPGATSPGLEHSNGGLIAFAGGLPLHGADGRMIGAVGVSGGSVAQDQAIVRAAAAALGG